MAQSPAPTGAAGGWHLAAPARTSGGGVNGSDRTAVSPNRAMPRAWAVVGPWLKIGPGMDGDAPGDAVRPSVCLSACSPQGVSLPCFVLGWAMGSGEDPRTPPTPKAGVCRDANDGEQGMPAPMGAPVLAGRGETRARQAGQIRSPC